MDNKKGKKNPKKSVQEAISIDNLTINRVSMFSRYSSEYIVSYKLMSLRKALERIDINLFTHISVEIICNMVKDFKTHRCALGFYGLFVGLIEK